MVRTERFEEGKHSNNLKFFKFTAIIVLACILPVMLIDDPDLADPNNFFIDTDETRKVRYTIYSNPKYVEVVRVLLPKLLDVKFSGAI